jgi:hypothetical protein
VAAAAAAAAAAEGAGVAVDVAEMRRRLRRQVGAARGLAWLELRVGLESGGDGPRRSELERWGFVRSMAAVAGARLGVGVRRNV